ncbi:hypothetical protein C6361_05175 [Plantactinospora sp. BC1]|uniref:hypothetical protein n=1 Tax=Plantactinospora sp. BC1 TaxID=2108470 RepID=UPI000D16CD02|nr:hypothetical protein [Plantactinospora sp. BC1]AVT28986.1 hypothetical protein C6361_05175 [Plantactinospora sp. BC1]
MIARFPSPAVALGLAGLAALAALAVPAAPAAAHPFGPPSTARISVHGSRVDLAWLAAEDDWVALGQSLGAFEDPALGAVATDLTGEQKLQRSPRVHDYLLERIAVRQGGTPCPGRLDTLDRLLDEGARLVFDCPAEVVDLDVTVGALTDLNEAYRTMLTSQTPAAPDRTLFTAAEQTHRVRFTPGAGGLPGSTVATLAGVGAALLVGVAALVTVRLRRRSRSRS